MFGVDQAPLAGVGALPLCILSRRLHDSPVHSMSDFCCRATCAAPGAAGMQARQTRSQPCMQRHPGSLLAGPAGQCKAMPCHRCSTQVWQLHTRLGMFCISRALYNLASSMNR